MRIRGYVGSSQEIEVNMTEEDEGAQVQPQGRKGKLRKGKTVSGAEGQSGTTSPGRNQGAGGGKGRAGLKKLRGRVAKLETEMQELRDRLKDRESKA